MSRFDDERAIRRAINLCRAECALAEAIMGLLKAAPDETTAQRLMSIAIRDLQRAETVLRVVTAQPDQPHHFGDC